ncbi:hypothetical protein BLOT_014745 [Blomia tropicalis]|nr:hypothetical protein BLOT_014745 [Blomia tropicalis]
MATTTTTIAIDYDRIPSMVDNDDGDHYDDEIELDSLVQIGNDRGECPHHYQMGTNRSSPSPSSTSPTTSAPLSQSTIRKPSISIECASAILTFVDLILTANERMSNEAQAQPAIAIIPIVQDEALVVVNHVLHILRLSCVHITTSSS